MLYFTAVFESARTIMTIFSQGFKWKCPLVTVDGDERRIWKPNWCVNFFRDNQNQKKTKGSALHLWRALGWRRLQQFWTSWFYFWLFFLFAGIFAIWSRDRVLSGFHVHCSCSVAALAGRASLLCVCKTDGFVQVTRAVQTGFLWAQIEVVPTGLSGEGSHPYPLLPFPGDRTQVTHVLVPMVPHSLHCKVPPLPRLQNLRHHIQWGQSRKTWKSNSVQSP